MPAAALQALAPPLLLTHTHTLPPRNPSLLVPTKPAHLPPALPLLLPPTHTSHPQVIEELSKGIVNKLLHGPMTALRCDGADPSAVSETLANMEALERMFGLTGEDDLTPAQAQKVAAKAGARR